MSERMTPERLEHIRGIVKASYGHYNWLGRELLAELEALTSDYKTVCEQRNKALDMLETATNLATSRRSKGL